MDSHFSEVKKYLGRYFSFCGKVVKGKGNGKNLGYPTANLFLENKWKLIPENGVYAVIVSYKSETFIGMMNIGYNPTFNSNIKTIEVHVLDFEEDICGQELEVSVVQKIRDEKKFSSVEELRKVLEIDENKVRLIFKKKDYIKKG